MKNGLLVWNVVLTLIAGYLLIAHFGSKTKKSETTGRTNKDTVSSIIDFRIAYFEMDSVEANFDLVKEVKAELTKKEESINAELDALSKKFQQRYNYFQGQAQGGTMTEAQSNAASQELKTLDDQIKSRKQNLDQEYSELAMRRGKEVKTTIEDFLKGYNATRNYAYIVAYEQGLFYYKDSAFNITEDVITGLNQKHKSGKKN